MAFRWRPPPPHPVISCAAVHLAEAFRQNRRVMFCLALQEDSCSRKVRHIRFYAKPGRALADAVRLAEGYAAYLRVPHAIVALRREGPAFCLGQCALARR